MERQRIKLATLYRTIAEGYMDLAKAFDGKPEGVVEFIDLAETVANINMKNAKLLNEAVTTFTRYGTEEQQRLQELPLRQWFKEAPRH